MDQNSRDVWLPAKQYGWGWGLPCVWQGRATYAACIALTAVSGIWLPPTTAMGCCLVYAGLTTISLLTICLWKGVSPAWRWDR